MEILVLMLLFAVLSGGAASSYGRSGFLWFVLGFFTGPIALLLVLMLGKSGAQRIIEEQRAQEARTTKAASKMKQCPACFGEIDARATICRHCRTPLEPEA